MSQPKLTRGTKFIHRNWKNEEGENITCVVTSSKRGIVYWKEYSESKARHFFDESESDQYVLNYLEST